MALSNHFEHQFFRIVNWFLAPLEPFFAGRDKNRETAGPIFIIGSPRSGTTILYQILIHSFDFAYVNNLVGNLYRCPNLGSELSHQLGLDAKNISFESTHGVTRGLAGPNEFGNFWYRWFPKAPHYADEKTVSVKAGGALRRSIAAIQSFSGRPLLLKNTVNSMRIRALQHLFPKALFIVSERDPVYTAQSIYKVRAKRSKKERWWSTRPQELKELLALPLIEQCVYQVYYLTKQIETDSKLTDCDRFFWLNYERLCTDTGNELSRIEEWLKLRGIPVKRRAVPVPTLKASDKQALPDKDFDKIRSMVRTLWPE